MVGGHRRPGPGPPASIQVSQSCGSSTAAVRAAFCRFVLGHPAQLGHRERRRRHRSDRVGTGLRTAEMLDHLADLRRGPQVVPQQRRPDDGSGVVQRDHAVLLTADGDRRRPLQQSGTRLLQRLPPQHRVDLGAGWVRGRRLVDDRCRRPPGPATPWSTGSTNRSRPPERRPVCDGHRASCNLASVGSAINCAMPAWAAPSDAASKPSSENCHAGTSPPARASTRGAQFGEDRSFQVLRGPPGSARRARWCPG